MGGAKWETPYPYVLGNINIIEHIVIGGDCLVAERTHEGMPMLYQTHTYTGRI
jgi:hypothetical protein